MDTLYARFRESLPLDAPREGGPVWTHMVPADGRVPGFVRVPAGHEIPGRGTSDKPADVECVTIFNRQVLESILQSFGNEILVDYEHFSHDPDKSTEAAGWGREVRMSARGDGVEIEVEWTAPAREKIVSGVYRYISPEFDGRLELVDGTLCFFPTRVTGAGLTNRPKLTMLRPVSANRNTQHTPTMDNALQLLCGLIGCADSATPEELAQAVDAYKQRVSALEAENQSFKDGQIEADMKANEDVIGKCRDEAKALLATNRDAALKLFAAQRESLAKAKPADQQPPQPLHQQHRATPPDPSRLQEPEGDGGREELVREIMNRQGCTYLEAWNTARQRKPELFVVHTPAEE